MKYTKQQEKLTEALNRIDELASYSSDNNLDEAKQQEKDYLLLWDFITGEKSKPLNRWK